MTSTDTQHRTPSTTAPWVWRDASLDDASSRTPCRSPSGPGRPPATPLAEGPAGGRRPRRSAGFHPRRPSVFVPLAVGSRRARVGGGPAVRGLRDRGGPRTRRHGRRVPRAPLHGPGGSRGRAQGDPPGVRGPGAVRRALPRRGPARGVARALGHRAGVRGRRGGRRAVHRHAADRRARRRPSSRRAAPSTPSRSPAPRSASPARSTPRTPRAWCIATSSRRTSWWTPTATPT